MMIAPLDASEPYKAAAAAPFNTVMDSISCGLRSFPLDAKSRFRTEYLSVPPIHILIGSKVELFIGTPSITYRGWLLPDMEVMFRNTTVVDDPGAPPVEVTFIPETRPCNAETKLSLPESMISDAFTFCTADPTERATRFIPNSPVITTSSNISESGTNTILTFGRTGTSCVTKPT